MEEFSGVRLGFKISQQIFQRDGRIMKVIVSIKMP
jgi:hypothetical protein